MPPPARGVRLRRGVGLAAPAAVLGVVAGEGVADCLVATGGEV